MGPPCRGMCSWEVGLGLLKLLSSLGATFRASDTEMHRVPLIFEAQPPIGVLTSVALMGLHGEGRWSCWAGRGSAAIEVTRAHSSSCDQ